jgi:hypothetical protein
VPSTSGKRRLDSERSRAARDLAQDALVSLVHELGEFHPPMIVLGGLVPELLTRGQDPPAPPHLGTTDVDVLIDLQVSMDKDLSRLEDALVRLGFTPDEKIPGWRWLGPVRGATVKIEFLCEDDEQPAQTTLRPAGCSRLGAANLRGVGFVREDCETEEITGVLPDGREVTVSARFAGLQGYLLAKAAALRDRGLDKDYYDFTYVAAYNRLGGPAEAARALRDGPFADRLAGLRSLWIEIADRFAAPDRAGAAGYAAQALSADPSADIAQLRRDAVDVVTAFICELGVE